MRYNPSRFRIRDDRVFGRGSASLWPRAAVFSLAYFLCAWLGSLLSVRGSTNVSFWLPAGLFVSVLLLNHTRDWPWLALAVLPANLAFDFLHDPIPDPKLFLVFYVANVIRSVLGAWLVRRFVVEYPTLATLREFWGLMGLAGVCSALVGATLGAAALTGSGLSHSFFTHGSSGGLGALWRSWSFHRCC